MRKHIQKILLFSAVNSACNVGSNSASPNTAAVDQWSDEQLSSSLSNCSETAVEVNPTILKSNAILACACVVDAASKKWAYSDFVANEFSRTEEMIKDGTFTDCLERSRSLSPSDPRWTSDQKVTANTNCTQFAFLSQQSTTLRQSKAFCSCAIDAASNKYKFSYFASNETEIAKELEKDGTLGRCLRDARNGFPLESPTISASPYAQKTGWGEFPNDYYSFDIGGSSITKFRYKVISGQSCSEDSAPYSDEKSIGSKASGTIGSGDYTICVVGKGEDGIWGDDSDLDSNSCYSWGSQSRRGSSCTTFSVRNIRPTAVTGLNCRDSENSIEIRFDAPPNPEEVNSLVFISETPFGNALSSLENTPWSDLFRLNGVLTRNAAYGSYNHTSVNSVGSKTYYFGVARHNWAGLFSSVATCSVNRTVPEIVVSSNAHALSIDRPSQSKFIHAAGFNWAFVFNGTTIEYFKSSSDSAWAKAGEIPATTSDFSVSHQKISGVDYFLLVALQTTKMVDVFRGVLSGGNLSFEAPAHLVSGSAEQIYSKPAISISSQGTFAIALTHENNSSSWNTSAIYARFGSVTSGSAVEFEPDFVQLGQRQDPIRDIAIISREAGEFVVLANRARLSAYHYINGVWRDENSGGSPGWRSYPGLGINGPINALATFGNKIVVGGEFTSIGDCSLCQRIALFDGVQWTPLRGGLNDTVHAILPTSSGIYVGGRFTRGNPDAFNAGGLYTNKIIYWNGANWSALGSGITSGSAVLSMTLSGSDLYVGGSFSVVSDSSGSVSAMNVARWNGTSWSAVGSGISNQVNALVAGNNRIYAASTGVLSWNGVSWNTVGGANSGSYYSLAVDGTNLYAGSSGGVSKWNGTSWESIGSGLTDVRALIVDGQTIYAGQTFYGFAEWNGTQWNQRSFGGNKFGSQYTSIYWYGVRALLIANQNIYAGGNFDNISYRWPSAHLASRKINSNPDSFDFGGWDGISTSLDVTNSTIHLCIAGTAGITHRSFDGTQWSDKTTVSSSYSPSSSGGTVVSLFDPSQNKPLCAWRDGSSVKISDKRSDGSWAVAKTISAPPMDPLAISGVWDSIANAAKVFILNAGLVPNIIQIKYTP